MPKAKPRVATKIEIPIDSVINVLFSYAKKTQAFEEHVLAEIAGLRQRVAKLEVESQKPSRAQLEKVIRAWQRGEISMAARASKPRKGRQ